MKKLRQLDVIRRLTFSMHERRGQLTTTWAGYKKAGPLLVSTDHRRNADAKPARIFFTDVAVKMAGSNDRVNAK